MAVPLLLPWAGGSTDKMVAMVDAPHIAATPTAVVMGSQMVCAPAGAKRDYSADGTLCNPALWVVPKRLPGGGGLMSGSVARGTRGVHFHVYDPVQYHNLYSRAVFPVQLAPSAASPMAIASDSVRTQHLRQVLNCDQGCHMTSVHSACAAQHTRRLMNAAQIQC